MRLFWPILLLIALVGVVVTMAPETQGIADIILLISLMAFVPMITAIYGLRRDWSQAVAGARQMAERSAKNPGVRLRSIDEIGKLACALNALSSDLRDLVRREAQMRNLAERSEEDKSSFLMAVSHELGNPLNSILGFSDVLLQEIDGEVNEAQREDIEMIRDAGAHLRALLDDLMTVATTSEAAISLRFEHVDLEAMLKRTTVEMSALLRGRDITLNVDAGDDTNHVYGDPTRIRQVLTNLGSNAARHTKSGEIRIRARRDEACTIISFEDSGCGVPKEWRTRIFADFEQILSGQGTQRGSGLGLAISKYLVELHGGKIWVDDSPFGGAAFHFTIPHRSADE